MSTDRNNYIDMYMLLYHRIITETYTSVYVQGGRIIEYKNYDTCT